MSLAEAPSLGAWFSMIEVVVLFERFTPTWLIGLGVCSLFARVGSSKKKGIENS
jgi:hypothetical protein